MSILEWCQQVQGSQFGTALLGSRYLFPLIETVHVLALSVSVGLLALIDLRLIGVFMRHRPAAELLRPLRPWMLGGFAIMLVTGGLLFWSEAADVWVKPLFRLKLVALAVAGVNALAFEAYLGRRVGQWGRLAAPPAGARFAGWLSLVCWAVVILCGRWVAYGV